MTSDRLMVGALAGSVAAIAVIIVAVLMWGGEAQAKWEADCLAVGGHVISDSDTAVGVGYAPGNGKPGSGGMVVTVTPSTKYYCLNEQGGIVGIR